MKHMQPLEMVVIVFRVGPSHLILPSTNTEENLVILDPSIFNT